MKEPKTSNVPCPNCKVNLVEMQGGILRCPLCGFERASYDFTKQLNISMEAAGKDWVEQAYQEAFGNLGLLKVESITDLALQRKGYDKVCHFKNGKQVIFDEKHRSEDYGDILIEIWSIMERRVPSWLNNNADYIVHFFEPTKRVVWLPLLLLNKWLKTRKEIIPWINNPENETLLPCPPWNRVIYTPNEGYTTASIAGPNELILAGIRQVMEGYNPKVVGQQLNYLDLIDF